MTVITRNNTWHRVGASHQRAKLTTEQVQAMRSDYESGRVGYVALSHKYGCGISTVRDIVQYRTRWAA